MKARPPFQFHALVLCIVALCVAQVFGGRPDYFCLCGGKPVQTQVAFCYGPHGEQCAENERHGGTSDAGHNQGERRDHPAVSNDVLSRPADAPLQVSAPQLILSILPLLAALPPPLHVREIPPEVRAADTSPPLGIVVARTIVLLI